MLLLTIEFKEIERSSPLETRCLSYFTRLGAFCFFIRPLGRLIACPMIRDYVQ